MKRKRVIVAAAVFALCAIGICILIPKRGAPPARPRPPAPAAPQALPPAVTAVDKALDAVIAGKAPLRSVRVTAKSGRKQIDLDLDGTGLVFIDGTQVKLSPEQLKDLLKLVRMSGFGAWEETYGGPAQPAGGARRDRWAKETLSMTLVLGKMKKRVRQLEGGEKFEGLPALMKEIRAALAPRLPGGVQVSRLSRKEALEKIAEGTLAPAALTVMVEVRAQGLIRHPDSWTLYLNRDKILVRVKGKQRRVALSKPEREAIARRLAGVLAKADIDELPMRLLHPTTMISFSMLIRGQQGRAATMTDDSPPDYILKRTSPTAREKFERAVAEIKRIHDELPKPGQQLSPQVRTGRQ